MYKKRVGTSGISGSLYEIKLISLLYFRAFHDNAIKKFQIASNVDEIGCLDDICFKAKVKGFDKPVMVFIQTKLRENERALSNIDWARYFDSYVKVRQQLNPKNGSFLNGTFDETECLFVIYTNTRMDLTAASDVPVRSGFFAKLNDLIGTGGTISGPNKQEEHVKLLYEVVMKEQITYVATRIAELASDDRKFKTLLTEEIVQRFHVVLAQKVLNLSEIQPGGYRIASFRHDFFDTNEEYLSIFKDVVFKEILKKKKRIIPTDLDYLLSEFFTEPTDALKLSKLIGTVITYKNGLWELDKQIIKTHKPDLIIMDVPRSTVDQAVEIAAREILLFLHFKVPAAFGNKDLTMRGSDRKIDYRIKHLVFKLISSLSMCISSNIVTIDNSLGDGFLQLDGGIAGAIGNIFVLDENPKLMKITDNWDQLGPLAKRLYLKLNSAIDNLHEYKFSFKISKFPILSFEWDNYAEDLVSDFLNRLLFYSNQADDNVVEEILKMEIENYQLDQANYFEAKTEAMFSRYYHQIQKWWMQPHYYTECLTRELNLFRQSTNNIIKDPLMSSINFICKSKIKQHNYTFTENAVSSMNLQDHSTTIITAENSILAVVKLMQHLKSKVHVVLDFNYIADLPTEDLNALCSELKYTNYGKVIILICGDIEQENLVCDKTNSRNDIETLEIIAKALQNKKTIVVTNQKSFKILQKYFTIADKILQDKKLSLIDLREESQMRIFETATVIFPGVDIRLDHLLKGWPKSGSRCRSADGAAATSAAADSKTGIGSQQTGAEEWNVPGTSQGRPPPLP